MAGAVDLLKPVSDDYELAIRELNHGDLDAQITQILRSLQIPDIIFPEARMVDLSEALPVSVTREGVSKRALISVHAAEDGKGLLPLAPFFNGRYDGIPEQFELHLGEASQTVTLPSGLNKRLEVALQKDALIGYMIGDIDRHVWQFLVSFELAGEQIAAAQLVSLDRGGAAAAAFLTPAEIDSVHHLARMNMLSNGRNTIDSTDARLPLPETLAPEFLATLASLKAALKEARVDRLGRHPEVEAKFQAFIASRYEAITAYYSTEAIAARRAAAQRQGDEREAADGADATPNDAGDRVAAPQQRGTAGKR